MSVRAPLVFGFVVGAVPSLLLHGVLLAGLGPWAIAGSEVLMAPAMLAVPLGLISLPFLAPSRTRQTAKAVALGSVSVVLFTLAGVLMGGRLRMMAFDLAARRAQPLVQALMRFEAEQARPPGSLAELTPRYLSSLPRGLPPLQLVTGTEAREHYVGNPWVLRADVGTGFLNWDQFLYFPLQNYPREGYGGVLERVRDWAYVCE